ncbi:DUF368 domain-containing protein [Actinomyces bowdenii]|uniref:DUF368 domain-containing protein n=1 Tax=Actinomyces bowdenii TaxID=131109 RepID=UPI00214A9AF6|nr:DUF368 domain-containing protein [Actinomyces bowdenii]MCR2053216.1 DUF368 domain-containing protein [Actinomyces bowdenii]
MSPHTPPTAPGRRTSIPGNLLRGGLIGLAETVPGVSGGTVALVVGIYDEFIGSASHLVSAIKALVTGPDRLASARAHLHATRWRLLIPVAVGMATVVLAVAGPMADAVEHYPVQMRGLFFGMVLASISVPVRMVRDSLNSRPLGYLGLFILGAVLGLALVVKSLQWLLAHHQVMTLCALIGLMVGGLRALWPWQDEMNRALAPGHSLGAVLALGLLGFALVTTMIVVDLAIARRSARERLPDTGS